MKKLTALVMTAMLAAAAMMTAGCGVAVPAATSAAETTAAETTAAETVEETTVSESEEESAETESETEAETETEAEETDGIETIEPDQVIRLAVLGGSTGWGAAKLIADAAENNTSLQYEVIIETSPKVIQEGLIAGEYDIAALSTNKAALLASKTGAVSVAAVNTLGVMYLISADGTEIADFEALKGMTVAIPEEPSYILQALLEANGVADEVTVETYATPADLLQAVIKGEVATAVLPEPLLSTAVVKTEGKAVVQMNLTEEWEKVYEGQELMQGCIVVSNAWLAEGHELDLQAFLDELSASITYVKDNAEEASALIETYFGVGAGVAKKAIPNCNMTFISGQEMKDALTSFYEVLITIPSSNIGEAVPADEFYYIAE